MSKKIILTGGGTAGHISPIVAIAEILKRNVRVQYLYVGSRNGPEKEIAKNAQINFYPIFTGKHRNYISFSNFIDLFKIFFGLIQSYFLLFHFKPDVIFAKGGYVTFPILFWAKVFKIPVIIHESDIIMGRANLWASRFAKKICLGFPLHYYHEDLPKDKIVYTGIPIKDEFFQKSGSQNIRPTILITGGSQGSQKINQLVKEILPDLLKQYDVYHLTGNRDFEEFKKLSSNEHYHFYSFTNEMPSLLCQANLVISRAGANTLAEISAAAKPAILIPLPSAHLDHQAANAAFYAEKNAAVVVSEKNLTSSSLLSIINHLLEDKEFITLLGHHASEFARQDAAQEIVEIIFEVENGK